MIIITRCNETDCLTISLLHLGSVATHLTFIILLGLINWRPLFALQQNALLSGPSSRPLAIPFANNFNDDRQ